MNDPLHSRLRQLASELREAAPGTPDWSDLGDAAARSPGHPMPRGGPRWVAPMAAATLIAAVAIGIVAVRSANHAAQPVPATEASTSGVSTENSIVQPATAAPTTVAPTPDETSSSTTAPAYPAPTSDTSPVPVSEATPTAIDAERRVALARFDSVSFTAVVREWYDGHPEMSRRHTNDVTLRNDGSMWATGDVYLLDSYDANTGIGRVHVLQPDGTVYYQEFAGQADDRVPLVVMLGGLDPTGATWGAEQTVATETSDGPGVWRIVQSLNGQTETWTIDRATGLITSYDVDWPSGDGPGVQSHRSVGISDIRTGVDFPADFPGFFPDGAVVDHTGDPEQHPLGLDEAAAQFGPGFVAPRTLPADTRAWVTNLADLPTYRDDSQPGDPTLVSGRPSTTAQISVMNGFARTTITLYKTPATTSEPPPGDITLTGGQWAGAGATVQGSAVTAYRHGVKLIIAGGTPQEALALANSLVQRSG